MSGLLKPRVAPRPAGSSPGRRWLGLCALGSVGCAALHAESFQLPTANQTLLAPGQEERLYVGTVGKPWTSGTFGCVRTSGTQLHEGLDIRCAQRDKRGEPTDPVLATASGTVAYINTRSSLSAYGIYVILRHSIDGLEIYSLYAHLSRVADGLRLGQSVQAGQPIAVMGHTANTRQAISQERAHLHFELGLLINERYPQWHRKTYPKGVNDHGLWNGLNLAGLDPDPILREHYRRGPQFSLMNLLRCQTELCRVVVRDTQFPWLQRYAALVQRNRVAEREGVAGYEIGRNVNGVPSCPGHPRRCAAARRCICSPSTRRNTGCARAGNWSSRKADGGSWPTTEST